MIIIQFYLNKTNSKVIYVELTHLSFSPIPTVKSVKLKQKDMPNVMQIRMRYFELKKITCFYRNLCKVGFRLFTKTRCFSNLLLTCQLHFGLVYDKIRNIQHKIQTTIFGDKDYFEIFFRN